MPIQNKSYRETLALRRDRYASPIQAFIPKPSLCMVPIVITNGDSFTFGAGSGYDHDITDYMVLNLSPSADITRYFNDDATKTKTLPSGQDSMILLDEDVVSVTLVNNSGSSVTVEVEGM